MDANRPLPSATGLALTGVVNVRTGRIRASGDLTAPGAHTLCGTVRGLHGAGHQRVVLDLTGVGRADDDGRALLDGLGQRISDAGGQLHVFWGSRTS